MNKKVNEKSFRRRTIATAIVVGVILLVLLARLTQFQIFEGPSESNLPESASNNVNSY